MDKDTLKKTHPFHERFVREWDFLVSAYEGVRALVEFGVMQQHPRESEDNYKTRMSEIFGFGYSRSIIDIFNHYLFRKPAKRELGGLAKDEDWASFVDDCDLHGNDLETFLVEQQRYASIYGHVGLLVDKPAVSTMTRKDEKDIGAYPYLAAYHPQNILEWKYERTDAGRPYLSFLKLLDEDGRFRIWTIEVWEVWEIPIDEKGKEGEPVMVASGQNLLAEIPFVWVYNNKTRLRNIGSSDISEVARIDVSILRNLSHGEEVIKYAAFPMMRKPRSLGDEPDAVGPTAILEYDPTNPESKPDWLEAKCLEPIDAILKWIDLKVSEIYRSSNAGGLAAVEMSRQAKSGVALKQEFQLLNAKLVGKAKNLSEAEMSLVWHWLKWQGKDSLYPEISIERPLNFDIEDLVTDLANALTLKDLIPSKSFQAALQKAMTRQALPCLKDEDFKVIDEEIEKSGSRIPASGGGKNEYDSRSSVLNLDNYRQSGDV